MNKNRLTLGVLIVVLWLLLWGLTLYADEDKQSINSEANASQTSVKSQVECPVQYVQSPFIGFSHRLEVWLSVLEWCESGGKGVKAVNPKDKDGTPSYYFFQFKPSTFKAYGIKYNLLKESISDEEVFKCMENYELTKQIVRLMVQDKQVNLSNEFPACLRKIGNPPVE